METKKSSSAFQKLATFIVDKRNLFFLLYVFAIIFSLFSMNWVQVENDVTKYLPEDTETRLGIVAMNENFAAFGTARVMINNVSYETAQTLADKIAGISGVQMVTFDETVSHYKDAAALIDVNFYGGNLDEGAVAAMDEIRTLLADFDVHVDTLVGYDENAMLLDEMTGILIVGVVIIVTVLTLTSRAYAEVLVLLMTFGVAAILNVGTNFLCGTISFISNSIAVVLQLALAIDYAIILCHRFSDEHETKPAREACITALSKAIPEISASSLTTISGLAALGFMEFGIGLDMAVVLIKAIFLSLMSVFTLMPGLLMLFTPLIDKTRHKKLLPNITPLGKFAVKTRRVVPFLFVFLLIGAFWLSNQCPFCYSYTDLETAKMTERQHAYFKIKDTFGTSNMVAVIVPSGDYEAEAAILEELEKRPEVESTMGLSGIEAMEGYKLTDSLTPRQLSELIGLDYEVVQVLYTGYAMEHDQYGEILNGLEEYDVPLFDMFLYLKDQMDNYNISLGDQEGIADMLGQLETARQQLQSEQELLSLLFLSFFTTE